MDVFQGRLAKGLRENIESRIDSECKRMASTPATDFSDYNRRIGLIKGLQQALEELAAIELTLDRAETKEATPPQFRRRYEE